MSTFTRYRMRRELCGGNVHAIDEATGARVWAGYCTRTAGKCLDHPAAPPPSCPVHDRPMKPSRFGGYYCPAPGARTKFCTEKGAAL